MTGVLTTGNGDGMLRDMTLFKDDDGTAYVVYSSEENATTIIHKLNDEYTGLSGDLEDISQNTPANFTEGVDYVRVFAGQYREAPAMFKDGDTYYLITSGQSGWNPNPCQYSYVEGDIFGEWAPNKKFAVNDIPYEHSRKQHSEARAHLFSRFVMRTETRFQVSLFTLATVGSGKISRIPVISGSH